MTVKEIMTNNEKSLLLYFGTCQVDRNCHVDGNCINQEDIAIAKRWESEGFIQFSRLPAKLTSRESTHYVVFSDAAWTEHAAAYRERAGRGAVRLRQEFNGGSE